MSQQRYALLSVTDKTGIVEFAAALKKLNFEILSTGGTANLLRKEGLPVIDVSSMTDHPECLDGRVKTLHPKIHGGILADRSNSSHLRDMKDLGFSAIDVVAVNLYDFAKNANGKDIDLSKTIEFIDIGGPAMLRAAAKNFANVYAVIDPCDYQVVIEELGQNSTSTALRAKLASKVFECTARYDQMIADDLRKKISEQQLMETLAESLPQQIRLDLSLVDQLRYGENSHQKAGLYTVKKQGLSAAKIFQGKELSYNNYMDLDAAAAIVADFDPIPALTIIKHTNPCGTAAGEHLQAFDLFRKALACDPKCAFGGIVACNIPIDLKAAQAMSDIFLECVIAPAYTSEALKHFATKKNLRILESAATKRSGRESPWTLRSVEGGLLVQTPDDHAFDTLNWTCVSETKPSPACLEELKFAMTLCRHVKSNAIVITKGLTSIGIGAGQMSRIDSANIAVHKARELGHSPCDAVAASDAFFPFRDSVDILAKAGITAIVHPGGSLRDQESVDAANEHGIVMMTSGSRHFKH